MATPRAGLRNRNQFMELELIDFENAETIDIAVSCSALFDQYDDPEYAVQADDYENLYPSIA